MEFEKIGQFDVPGEAIETLQLQHVWMETIKQRSDENGRIQPMEAAEDVPLIGRMIDVIGQLEKRILDLEARL